MKAGKVTEFLKAHDCDATEDELKEFVAEKAAQDSKLELSDEELEKVAGGDLSTAPCGIDCSKNCTGCIC